MSSPLTQRPGVFGIQSASGGVRSAIPEIPALASLMHWFDFTDIDQLFQDTGSTVPVIGDGDPILSILNKGFDGTKLIEDGAASGSVIHSANAVNRLPVGLFTGIELLSATIAAATSGDEFTFAVVEAVPDTSGSNATSFGWQTSRCGLRMGGGNRAFTGFLGGIGVSPNPSVPFDIDRFQWFYAASSGAPAVDNYKGNDSTLVAPEHSFGGLGNDPSVAAGQLFAIGDGSNAGFPSSDVFTGELAEILIWDAFLDSLARDGIVDYFVGKYGAFPV